MQGRVPASTLSGIAHCSLMNAVSFALATRTALACAAGLGAGVQAVTSMTVNAEINTRMTSSSAAAIVPTLQ